MKISSIITILGVSFLLFYSLVNVLNFYGIGTSVYGIYLLFYVFLIVCMIVLPNEYPSLL